MTNGSLNQAIIGLKNHFLVFLRVAVLHWLYCIALLLAHILLNPDLPFFKNTVDPDQLASDEAS